MVRIAFPLFLFVLNTVMCAANLSAENYGFATISAAGALMSAMLIAVSNADN